MPVPRGSSEATLAAVGAVLDSLPPDARRTDLVFLGDLLHAARGRGPTLDRAVGVAFDGWRARSPGLAVHLIRGNHDRAAGDPPPAWGLAVHNEPWRRGPWALCHEPQPVDGAYALAGHWHPCVRLGGPAKDRLRLPCFWLGDPVARPVGVLPAFGHFTGMHPIERRPADRVWVVADGLVRRLPA